MRALAIDHAVLNVHDVERSARWYEQVLGMTRAEAVSEQSGPDRISLHFGAQKLNLRPADADQRDWFTGVSPQPGSDDLCFLVDTMPDEVVAQLGACEVAIERGPVRKRGARGAICSVYCRDPDGNLIELSSYL